MSISVYLYWTWLPLLYHEQRIDLNAAALYFQSELLQLGKCSLNAEEFQAAKSSYLDMMSVDVEMIDVLLRHGTSRTKMMGGR